MTQNEIAAKLKATNPYDAPLTYALLSYATRWLDNGLSTEDALAVALEQLNEDIEERYHELFEEN